MMDISIFNIYCFHVLAQQLNYTKAALLLNITQPALSKTIQILERDFGFALFERNTRKVKLTPAGQLLYDRTHDGILELTHGIDEAKSLSKGNAGLLRIGFLSDTFIHSFQLAVLNYKKQYPNVCLLLQDNDEKELAVDLLNHAVDIALVSDWRNRLPDDFERIELSTYDYCAIISKDNPLSKYDSINLLMLKNETFLYIHHHGISYTEGSFEKNRILNLCISHGFLPNLLTATPAKTLGGLLQLVGCNEGIALLPSYLQKLIPDDLYIQAIPIQDMDLSFHAQLCYSKTNQNPCVENFIKIVKSS